MKIGLEARWLQVETTGFGKYALNLLRELNGIASGHDFLVYLKGRCESAGLFASTRMRPVVIPLPPPFYKQIGIPGDIICHDRRLDLFHFLYNAPSLCTPCPFVLTLHDLSYLHVPEMVSWLKRTTTWWQLKLKAARAKRIITISDNSKRDIVNYLRIPETRVDVIYHGIEPTFAPASSDRKRALVEKYGLVKPFLLYVGTYLPHKNLETLMRAFAQLTSSWRGPLELVLAGKQGRNSSNIKNVVEQLSLGDRVRMLGFVPDEDLPALYSLCTSFVYPSRYEGFGLPLLEAMACGAPVVAARSSCLPEIGGDAAEYFESNDVGMLAGSLLRILKEQDFRHELIRRGSARAVKFSWRAAAERTLQVYELATQH